MEQHIHESNLIENIDDPAEDAQSLLAWEWLKEQPDLSHGVICKVQKMITLHQPLMPHQRGYYRDLSKTNVFIGKEVAPHYNIVPHLMENWLLDYKLMPPVEMHIRFERAHPFVDGNGRTGRMLMWWMQLKRGQEPWLIEARNKQSYYGLFKPEKANKTYNFDRSSDNDTSDW